MDRQRDKSEEEEEGVDKSHLSWEESLRRRKGKKACRGFAVKSLSIPFGKFSSPRPFFFIFRPFFVFSPNPKGFFGGSLV